MPARISTLTISLALVGAAALGVLACDKSQAPTDDPSTTSGSEQTGGEPAADTGGEPDASATNWHDMDHDARMTYMGTTVMPAMKEAFKQQGVDTFKCANCHGADYKEVGFKMPNDLTPLDPENPIQSGMDLDEEVTKFMVSVVLPQMAEMLGEETDITTGKGEFGCLSCHLPSE